MRLSKIENSKIYWANKIHAIRIILFTIYNMITCQYVVYGNNDISVCH